MSVPEPALTARARRAYEWGRVRAAFPMVLIVVPMAGLSWLACRQYAVTGTCGVLLAVVLLLSLWRGQQFARGARMGLLAGLGPFLLPMVTAATGHLCWEDRCLLFPTACIAGGLVAGLAVWIAQRHSETSAAFLVPALAVAALAGSMGCVVAGALGVAGMAGGMAVGTLPLLAARARTA